MEKTEPVLRIVCSCNDGAKKDLPTSRSALCASDIENCIKTRLQNIINTGSKLAHDASKICSKFMSRILFFQTFLRLFEKKLEIKV